MTPWGSPNPSTDNKQTPPGAAKSARQGGIVRVMSGSSSVLEAFGPRPLTAAEWAEAQRVWDRLRAELGQLISGLPEHARHASGLARELGVLRVTCQRVVSALSGDPSPASLAKLPGPEGLRQFVTAFAAVGASPSHIASAEAAVGALERLITVTAGSQTKLNERLIATGTANASGGARAEGAAGLTPGGLATQAQRQALHEAATAVTGRACEVALSIYAFRQHPDAAETLERALCKGQIGAVVAPGGLPLVLGSGDTLKTEEAALRQGPGPVQSGRTAETILSAFSTSPLPTITNKSRTGATHQVIDPSAFSGAGEGGTGLEPRPVDVVTALRACHLMYDPKTRMPTLDAVWSLVNGPSARLIFDVYLHADMERQFRPSIDALLWSPDLSAPAADRWTIRLPNQPRLQLLGRGLTHAGSELYSRHGEISHAFFGHIGWDPDDFVGFRCEVRYPVWRAGYCMGFEYLGEPGPKAG